MTDKRDEALELIEAMRTAVAARYTLGDIIGYGRGGISVQARDVSGRMVAMKIAWKDEEARAQVLRETELTAKIEHTNVLVPRMVEAPEPLLAVETTLMRSSLGDLLDSGKPVPFDTVCKILTVIASALDKAHSLGIVHGGILPEKIFVDDNGMYFIGDFSLRLPQAVFVEANRPSLVGFTAYTPPEQRHDLTSSDGRIDQFALAVVAYELLRGNRRWRFGDEGVLEVDAIDMVVSRPIAPGAPASASAAIRRGTARDPAYRYATCSEFARAFAGLAKGATPAEHMFHEPTFVDKRRRWLWLLPVAAGVAAVAAIQPTMRQSAIRLWRADWTSGEFWHGNVEMPGRAAEVGMRGPTPTQRGASNTGSPSSTRTGGSTVRGDASTKVGGPVNPGPTFDPFPRLPPTSNTQVGATSPRVEGANPRSPSSSGDRTTTPTTNPAVSLSGRQKATNASPSSATASADARTGSIEVSISGSGSAEVLIDGKNRGRAPLTWQASAGRHIVTLRPATSFSPLLMEVNVTAGATTRAVFKRR
jgi:serine/threonine protein kinase